DDLVTFNRWLCMTRLRAAGAVVVFTLALEWLGIGDIASAPALAACAGLFVVSGIGLSWDRLARAPRVLFYLQSLADLAGVTFGIGASAAGVEALLFRSVYALTIVPAGLISVPSGLAMATAATLGHEALLVHERGLSLATLASVESLVPTFLFFLLAQQCFFYGAHLKRKNTALASLAERLEESRQRLGAEARTSAALYHERVLAGFLAVGFGSLPAPEREQAVEFLSGIAQHATIVLRNARLLEEVRLASAMKSEFVGAISHELRSPLNVMLGYLE